MTMYSELLGALSVDGGPVVLAESQEELVISLRQCRRRLSGHAADEGPILAEDLALDLDYDRLLLRLCSALSIAFDPELFEEAASERQRLEELLRERGVDVRPPGNEHPVDA
ncbi:MAG TPA: hypothetical protein VND70_07295 [Acidimicrobiales bacterium]|nr:hypothetical protein [Acidimicrobiales bacterium]